MVAERLAVSLASSVEDEGHRESGRSCDTRLVIGVAHSRRRLLRALAVFGLLSAAVFIALPWLGCSSFGRVNGTLEGYLSFMRICTVGFPGIEGTSGPQPYGLPGFRGPYWGNLIVGIVYILGAIYVAVSRRFS